MRKIKLFTLTLLLNSCGAVVDHVGQLVRVEMRDTVDTAIECPGEMRAKRAVMKFWMNGAPKALEMECQ